VLSPETRTDLSPGPREAALAPAKWILICIALYLVRVLPWAMSELWHDEVITLGDFVLGPEGSGPLHVFRSYPVANNHMLFSAFGWWWVRFLGYSLDEYLLRLPCMAFGAIVIVLAVRSWRRWLGAELACLAGVTLAISPVFGAFACEFRGYSLTMLLSAIAVQGLAEMSDGRLRRGLWVQLPALFLLPLVIPSNALLAFAHALFIALWPGWPGSRRTRFAVALALAGAGALGLSYYLTLWDQFAKVLHETTGWTSGLGVLGAVSLGVWAHLGWAGIALPVAAWRRSLWRPDPDGQRVWAAIYAGCVAVPILATLFGNYSNAPFPRVYLLYLLPLTFAAFRFLRPSLLWSRRSFLLAAGLTVAIGFAWERACDLRTAAAVRRGEHPQDLLQQYYRNRTDLRGVAAGIAQAGAPRGALVVTDAYDFPTFRFYWAQYGMPAEAVFAQNRLPKDFWPQARSLPNVSLHVVAGDESVAARLFAAAAAPGAFVPGPASGNRRLYSLLPPSAP
jgi:hypothetical protein